MPSLYENERNNDNNSDKNEINDKKKHMFYEV